MAATVLLPQAHCHRAAASAAATTTTSGRGALAHCAALPPRQRRGSRAVRAAAPPEQSRGVSLGADSTSSSEQASAGDDTKAALYRALDGVDRGIFGMTSAQRSEIHGLVELLEARNPTPEPTAALHDKVNELPTMIRYEGRDIVLAGQS